MVWFNKGSQERILNQDCTSGLKDCFYLSKQCRYRYNAIYVAFHLDFHCLPKYPFRGFQYTQGYGEHGVTPTSIILDKAYNKKGVTTSLIYLINCSCVGISPLTQQYTAQK